MKKYATLLFILPFLFACVDRIDPNVNSSGEDELESLETSTKFDAAKMQFSDVVYVPIYSDIYVDETNQKQLLSATLSVRNTHFSDTLYIAKIDYYNSHGHLVRKYIETTLALPPMATVNYVIEKEDDTGGSGANFIVSLNARSSEMIPIIQAVMIGHYGNKALAFTSDGYSMSPD